MSLFSLRTREGSTRGVEHTWPRDRAADGEQPHGRPRPSETGLLLPCALCAAPGVNVGSLEREPRGQWQLSGRRDGRRSREQRPAYPPPTREGRTCTNTAERRPESPSPKPAPTTEETAGQGKAPLSGRAERAGGRLPAPARLRARWRPAGLWGRDVWRSPPFPGSGLSLGLTSSGWTPASCLAFQDDAACRATAPG